MHARHYLHEANTDTLLYKLWQKLRDTPERAANNQYTITPLPNLSIPTHKVHQLATKLHCHAIKSLNKITTTRHKIHFINNNSDNGGYKRGLLVEWLVLGGIGAGRIAWLTTRRPLLVFVVSLFRFRWGSGEHLSRAFP